MRLSSREENPWIRKAFATLLLGVGIAWLAYKAPYLGLFDVPSALQAFLILPGLALLIAAGFVAFREPHRHWGIAIGSVGAVAALWVAMQARPQAEWTFYTPYAAMSEPVGSWPMFDLGSPVLPGIATLGLSLGLGLGLRKSIPGFFLLGIAGFLLAVHPSRFWSAWRFSQIDGMPRRYHYYYVAPSMASNWIDWALPLIFAVLGIFVIFRRRS